MQFILLTWSPKQDCLHEGLCWQMSLNGCQRMHVFATTAATSLPVSMFRRHEQMSDTTNWRQNSNWIQLTIASLYIVHLRLSWKIAKEFEISRPIFESIKSDAFRLHAKTHHALAGRFGNELFVVAAALVHAHRNHHPVLLIRPGKIPTRIDNVEVHLRYISQDLFGAKVMWEMDMDAWKACFFFLQKHLDRPTQKRQILRLPCLRSSLGLRRKAQVVKGDGISGISDLIKHWCNCKVENGLTSKAMFQMHEWWSMYYCLVNVIVVVRMGLFYSDLLSSHVSCLWMMVGIWHAVCLLVLICLFWKVVRSQV